MKHASPLVLSASLATAGPAPMLLSGPITNSASGQRNVEDVFIFLTLIER